MGYSGFLAVGIGGAYMCIYGMEGPGGYQFVGRTVPVWSRHRPFRQTTAERPWLLRWFDQTFTDLLPLWSSVYRDAYRS